MPMFSIPLSGLTSSSTALSTIANNLANQNTIGYKDGTALFSDLFYQRLGETGGGDPIEVGAGTTIAAITTNFNDGSVSPTGVDTDVAIQGDGFFITSLNGSASYTRAGDFKVSPEGYLSTQDGALVQGYQAVGGTVTSASGLGPLDLGKGQVSPPSATTQLQLTTNLNAAADVGSTYNTSVDVYDSLGASHTLTFTFTHTAANTWTYNVSLPAGEGTVTLPAGGNTLSFGSDGTLQSPATNINFDITGLADGAADMSGVKWNLFDSKNSGSSLTQMAAESDTPATTQNGYGSGMLESFAIGSDGTIEGTFSNGKTSVLGQIAIASFPNVQGLMKSGQNSYRSTLASGQAAIGTPGSGGRGTLEGGALELSNVDMATEFSSLIVAQRGYEANAKVITTFDEITQDTINLKR